MGRPRKISRVDYSQFLFGSQTNYSLTYFADHLEDVSHDSINRYLQGEHLRPSLVWEHIKDSVEQASEGMLIFDDTVLDKSGSSKIECSQKQYSGQSGHVVMGIGVVNCVYVHPSGKWWVIDYRIYDKKCDGKSKIDHVMDMLKSAVFSRNIIFNYVLMDTWYATHNLMLFIDDLGKTFYCPIKSNRKVSRTDSKFHHSGIKNLEWSDQDLENGIELHISGFPDGYHVNCFRVAVSTNRTDFVVTNDLSQDDSEVVEDVYKLRWPIETFHRELKQTTGVQRCQCRKRRIQRNHISCAYLVWVRTRAIAQKLNTTVYQLKENLLSDYLKQQLRSPAYSMSFA